MPLGDAVIDPRRLQAAGAAMQGQNALHGAPVANVPAGPQDVPPIAPANPGIPYTPLPPPSPPKEISSREQYRQLRPDYKFADEQPKDTGPSAMSRLGDWLRSKKDTALNAAEHVGLGLALPGTNLANVPGVRGAVQKVLPQAPDMGPPLAPQDEQQIGPPDDRPQMSVQPPQATFVGASSTNLIDPADRENVDATYGQEADAIGKQQDANNQIADAEGDEQRAVGVKYDQASNQIQDNAAEMAHEANKQRRLEGDWSKRIDKASADLAAMHEDKNRLWNSKSTGGKVRSALSVALGGFVEGVSNGQVHNAGLQMLNRDIDLDLESQRKDHDLARGRVGDMKNLYSEAYKASGNHAQAMIDARAMAISHIQSEMMAIAARSNSKKVMARATGLNAVLDQQKAQLFRQGAMWDASTKKYVDAHWQAAAGGGPVDKEELKDYRDAQERARVPQAAGALTNAEAALGNIEKNGGVGVKDWLAGKAGVTTLQSAPHQELMASAHQLAMALAGEEGIRNNAVIEDNMKDIVGDGSAESFRRGVNRAREVILSRQRVAGSATSEGAKNYAHAKQVGGGLPVPLRTDKPSSSMERLHARYGPQ